MAGVVIFGICYLFAGFDVVADERKFYMKQGFVYQRVTQSTTQLATLRSIQIKVIIEDFLQVRKIHFCLKNPDPAVVLNRPGFKFTFHVDDIAPFVAQP